MVYITILRGKAAEAPAGRASVVVIYVQQIGKSLLKHCKGTSDEAGRKSDPLYLKFVEIQRMENFDTRVGGRMLKDFCRGRAPVPRGAPRSVPVSRR